MFKVSFNLEAGVVTTEELKSGLIADELSLVDLDEEVTESRVVLFAENLDLLKPLGFEAATVKRSE